MVSTESVKYKYNAITINNISPLLTIVIGGILLSSTILIFEKIYYFWHQKSKTVCSTKLPHVKYQAAETKNQIRTLHSNNL